MIQKEKSHIFGLKEFLDRLFVKDKRSYLEMYLFDSFDEI